MGSVEGAEAVNARSPQSADESETKQTRRGKWWHVLHVALMALHPLSLFLLPWKAGERDARMAIGLLRVDPVRRRGFLCAMCYLSIGAAKVMMSGFAVVLIAFAASSVFKLQFNPGNGWFGEALFSLFLAVVLAAASLLLLTFFTLLFAACVRQKLWIDGWPDPDEAFDGRWPPVAGRERRSNWAAILVGVPSTIIPVLICLLLLRDPSKLTIMGSGMLGLFPARWIANRVLATTPEECYYDRHHAR